MAPSTLTVHFLETEADGLRSVRQATKEAQCLFSSRKALLTSLANKQLRQVLDVPGVYVLLGPAERGTANEYPRLYIGQADSVADRLERNHLVQEAKKWWTSCAAIRSSDDSPLDISACQFIESMLYKFALEAECNLDNRNAPRKPHMTARRERETEQFTWDAIEIFTAMNLNFFNDSRRLTSEIVPGTAARAEDTRSPKGIEHEASEVAKSLVVTVQERINSSTFPDVEWYWTAIDCRARVLRNEDSRIFLRLELASKWLRVTPLSQAQFKMSGEADLDAYLPSVEKAYKEALHKLET